MKILVGYTPAPEGVAAFDFATAHAKLVDAHLTVLNTGKNGDYSHPVYASAQDIDAVETELAATGRTYERSAAGKLITGSTAQAVLLNADVPVTCGPPKPKAG